MYLLDSLNQADLSIRPTAANQCDKPIANPLCCAICKNPITDQGQAIEVAGQHRHMKRNPSGQQFDIACFKHASGCLSVGQPSLEYAWFEGCAWQIGHCRRCMVQLGWCFSGNSYFFGLIYEQLTPCDSNGQYI